VEKKKLLIQGMHCVSCAQNIENHLKNYPGVLEVVVNYTNSKAEISFDPKQTSLSLLEMQIAKMGYKSDWDNVSFDQEKQIKYRNLQKTFKLFLSAAILSFPFIIQMLSMIVGHSFEVDSTWQFILATLIQFGCGGVFYRSSFYALKNKQTNMDVLVVLGATAAYLFSFCVYWFRLPYPLYFESSSLIIMLILFGRWLEILIQTKTSKALEHLHHLQPQTVRLEKNGQVVEVNISQIKKGDIFIVRPGDQIPVDGSVLEGETTVNESLLTGESLPVYKSKNSKIYAATINEGGYLKGIASSIGSETILAQIIRAVEKAQSSKAPMQKLADKISAIFVPCVLLISFLTFLIWALALDSINEGLINAVSVLVIACPCALGLATPTVLMVASGLGAQYGIFFKQVSAIELAEQIKYLFLDKTGTLTQGHPSVMGIYPHAKHSQNEVLQIAASLESYSSHPLAKAILTEAKEKEISLKEVKDFETLVGKGVSGTIEKQLYYLGSTSFAKEMGINIDSTFHLLEQFGESLVFIWTNQHLLGMITVADELRMEAVEVIRLLKEKGIQPILLTGDRQQIAEAVAKKIGIEEVKFELLPENKLQIIQEWKKRGRVGMIGDGMNDAPALAEADVSFALAFGSDIAVEAADITLMRNHLISLIDALNLSSRTMRKMKQNLFLAFVYNILAIPMAASGLLNPMIAAGTMAMSSISVIANALSLRYWKSTLEK
jgi:Cu+-exporting ATPase